MRKQGMRLAVIAAMAAGMAGAQEDAGIANGQKFGEWVVGCQATGVNQTLCGLSQNIVRTEDGALLASFVAFWSPDLSESYLLGRVPVGVFFPDGLSVGAQGSEERMFFSWQSCNQQLCEAALLLNEENLARLQAGEGPQVVAYRPGKGREALLFELRSSGLVEGLAALKSSLAQN